MSDLRRPLRATLFAFVAAGAVAALGGCPAAPPPNLTEATLNGTQLPADVPALVALIDSEDAKQTPASEENAALAVDRALEKEPRSYEVLWRGARTCVWLTEEFTDKARRASWAEKGVGYAQKAIAIEPNRVEGHYYLGENLGQSARTKTVGAYLMVSKVVKQGKTALQLDEKFDHAGPGRLLGNVYAKAPPWPASVGDTEEGVHFLRRVVEIAPEYPQNHLHFADALFADGKYDEAAKEYQMVLDAQLKPEWEHRGADWKKDAATGLQKIAEKKK